MSQATGRAAGGTYRPGRPWPATAAARGRTSESGVPRPVTPPSPWAAAPVAHGPRDSFWPTASGCPAGSSRAGVTAGGASRAGTTPGGASVCAPAGALGRSPARTTCAGPGRAKPRPDVLTPGPRGTVAATAAGHAPTAPAGPCVADGGPTAPAGPYVVDGGPTAPAGPSMVDDGPTAAAGPSLVGGEPTAAAGPCVAGGGPTAAAGPYMVDGGHTPAASRPVGRRSARAARAAAAREVPRLCTPRATADPARCTKAPSARAPRRGRTNPREGE